jgi:hypothetical protein
MRIPVRRALLPLLTLVAGTAVSLPAVSPAQAAACPRGELSAVALPQRNGPGGCVAPGRTIRGVKAAVTVPARGHGVVATALLVGGEETLDVSTAADGTVTIRTSKDAAGRAAPAVAPPACSDNTYVLFPWYYGVGGNYYWYYAPADDSRSGLSSADAEAAIVNATRAIVAGHNDCGLGGQPNVNQTYGGRVGVGPNITGSGCGQSDAWSITGWGSYADGVLAVTCTWYQPNGSRGIVQTSDMLANYNYVWWNGRGACPNNGWSFDLESVTTHERGHTLGLNHPPSGHDEETMAAAVYNCTTNLRTLALGDFNGLISLYGYR